MKRNLYRNALFVWLLLVLGASSVILEKRAVVEAAGVQAPMFAVDPFWPKPNPLKGSFPIVSTTIGFIGLGIMGKPMSRNLLRAGYPLVVYDRSSPPVKELVADGALEAGSAKEVAERSEVIITMLPDGPDVEQAVLSPNGALAGARRGAVLIDMSSINPLVAQKIGAACEERGVDFLDAPVSGGEPKAIDGTLAIMAGGNPRVFEKVTPILQKMGATVTLTGPIGAGNVTKLANQIIVACNIAAMGEAFILATRAGIDPEIVFNAIKGGLAGSTVLNAKAPMVIARNFKPGFKIRYDHVAGAGWQRRLGSLRNRYGSRKEGVDPDCETSFSER